MHDVLTIGVPLFAILAGNLFSHSDLKELRAEMNARFDRIEAELRYFHGYTGKL